MITLDIQLFHAINNLAGKSGFFDSVFSFFAQSAVIIFGLVLIVYLFVNRKVFWRAFFSAILARLVFTEIIRYLLPRERPFVALENVKQLIEKNSLEPSFPSGHAAILFSIAFSVYLFDKKIGVTLMIGAMIFTFARVYAGVHYPGDILGGIIMSLLAVFVVNKMQKRFIETKK